MAVKGHHKSAQPLDELWQRAGGISRRLADEGKEARGDSLVHGGSLQGLTTVAAKSDRLDKRRGWVIVAMMLAAAGGFWLYMDYRTANESPEETAAEEVEVQENLEFYEEHKCEINPNLYGC